MRQGVGSEGRINHKTITCEYCKSYEGFDIITAEVYHIYKCRSCGKENYRVERNGFKPRT